MQDVRDELLSPTSPEDQSGIPASCAGKSSHPYGWFTVFITTLQDRYAEFMRATRQWTLLRAMMQFGFGPKWRGEPGTGDLALFCAACPQPGVNIPDDWDSDPNA